MLDRLDGSGQIWEYHQKTTSDITNSAFRIRGLPWKVIPKIGDVDQAIPNFFI